MSLLYKSCRAATLGRGRQLPGVVPLLLQDTQLLPQSFEVLFMFLRSLHSCLGSSDPLKRCSQSRVTMSRGQPGCFPVWRVVEEKSLGEKSMWKGMKWNLPQQSSLPMAEQSTSSSSKSLQSLYLRADLPGPRAPQSLSLNADLHLIHTLFSLYPLAQASTPRTFLSTPESCIFILKNIDGKYLACHLTMGRRKILGYLRT